MTVIQIILTIVFVGFIRFWWKRRKFRELADKIPGPNGLPLIGVIHKAFGLNATGEIVVDSIAIKLNPSFELSQRHTTLYCD
jgi:hypothetical protein